MCIWQISAGRTHSAVWTCPAPVRRSHGATSTLQLGTPSSVPAQFTSLQDCSVEDIKARLQLLHHYSDLVYSSWRLLNLIPGHVSTLHTYVRTTVLCCVVIGGLSKGQICISCQCRFVHCLSVVYCPFHGHILKAKQVDP